MVVLSRRQSAELKSLPDESMHFFECDITQDGVAKSAIERTLHFYGRLDSIILNAGTLDPVVRLENATMVGWQECFNINVFANIPLVDPIYGRLANSRLKRPFHIFDPRKDPLS